MTHPHDRFLQLLQGDEHVHIIRVTDASGPPYSFLIEDAETLEYLTDAFRAAEPDGYVPKRPEGFDRTGPQLFVDVWTDRLGSYSTNFELPNDERVSGITVFCELDDHYHFWVPLPLPMPAPLAELFAAQREWDRANRPQR